MPRAGAKIHSHIEWHAHERDVDLGSNVYATRSQEGSYVRESWRSRGIERLEARVVSHRYPRSLARVTSYRHGEVISRQVVASLHDADSLFFSSRHARYACKLGGPR
jgi:hypothetical protein